MTSADLVLDSRYRLLERLATGGMGEVWRAADELLNRPVAVKLLRQEHISDEHALARFRAEARFAAALQHGGIAQVYDYGEHGERAYLVMELVSGEPLSRILARTRGLTPENTLDVVAQAARALQVAHTAGIIHRDVKPGNLMVTPEGTVKITDFGIARGQHVSSLTQTGMVMGTAHYVSPEQASGQPITPATDLYSLGVVAFECLTGRPPFEAEQPVAIALKHVREAPPELPDEVPAAMRELVGELLAKDPAQRPGSARELADRAYLIHDALVSGEPGSGSFRGTPEERAAGAYADDDGGLAATVFPAPAGAELEGGGAPDTLAGAQPRRPLADAGSSVGSAGERARTQRRAVLVATSVAAGMLLLGAIVVGSLWRGPASAGLKETRDQTSPGTREPTRPAASRMPSPKASTGLTPRFTRPPSGNNFTTSTSPTLSASPTGRPSTSPTTDQTPEEPTPNPTGTSTSTPPPSTPSSGKPSGDGS